MEALQKRMQEQVDIVKSTREKRTGLVQQRHQLTSQVTENDLVKKELQNLNPSEATIYKLIGPVLVSQDFSDASAVIEKRLEYLTNELKRVDAQIKECDRVEEEASNKIQGIQKQAQEWSARSSNEAAAAVAH